MTELILRAEPSGSPSFLRILLWIFIIAVGGGLIMAAITPDGEDIDSMFTLFIIALFLFVLFLFIPAFLKTELLVCVAVIAVAVGLMIPNTGILLRKAKLAEGVGLLAGARTHLTAYYAEHGVFPEKHFPGSFKTEGKYVEAMKFEDGSLHMRMHDETAGELIVSQRAVESGGGAMLYWACGNAALPAGHTAHGPNLTQAPPEYLPFTCR